MLLSAYTRHNAVSRHLSYCCADVPTVHYKEGRLARELVSYFRTGKSPSIIVSPKLLEPALANHLLALGGTAYRLGSLCVSRHSPTSKSSGSSNSSSMPSCEATAQLFLCLLRACMVAYRCDVL
jgi:hypothetical protein